MSNRGYSSFRNLNIVGLRKKRLTKGGGRGGLSRARTSAQRFQVGIHFNLVYA